MSAAARSLFVFGVYVIGAGMALAVAPDLLLALLRFPPPEDGWIRVVGVLALVIGSFHVLGARHGLVPYIRATVLVRVGVAAAFAALVVAGLMPAPLLAFGAVDLLSAVWTAYALRSEDAAAPAPAVS